MSFVGGGTDLPAFYRKYGGAVVSTSIRKYVNIVVNPKFDGGVRVAYSRTELCENSGEVEHPIVREALRMLDIARGIEVVSIADVPSSGTGLGSSSSFTVGLLNALHAFKSEVADKEQLGHESCRIEIDILKEPIGKQDQFAAAFGGLNFIRFNEDDTVDVEPLNCVDKVENEIETHILTFYTGIARKAGDLLKEQNEVTASGARTSVLKRMAAQACELRNELRRGNVEALGEALHEGWVLKQSLAPRISSSQICNWYERGRKAGAIGGKLLGAGAGGFLIFFAKPEQHESIRRELADLRPVRFRLDRDGSQVWRIWDSSEPDEYADSVLLSAERTQP
jgi:D-glycero-alpha-D-manno-heptose-7-phosphate kinase